MNKYIKKFDDLLKNAKTEQEREDILNKLYEEGVEDGVNSVDFLEDNK